MSEYKKALAQFKRDYLFNLLVKHRKNFSKVAKEAGITRFSVHKILGKKSNVTTDIKYYLQSLIEETEEEGEC